MILEKVFIDKNGDLITFPFVEKNGIDVHSYYQYIKEKKEKNYLQFLLTTDMMMNIAIDFLTRKDISVSNLQLYDGDNIVKNEILSYFERYHRKLISKDKLRYDLDYLCNQNCTNVVEISFKSRELGSIQITNSGIISYQNAKMKDLLMVSMNNIWKS